MSQGASGPQPPPPERPLSHTMESWPPWGSQCSWGWGAGCVCVSGVVSSPRLLARCRIRKGKSAELHPVGWPPSSGAGGAHKHRPQAPRGHCRTRDGAGQENRAGLRAARSELTCLHILL